MNPLASGMAFVSKFFNWLECVAHIDFFFKWPSILHWGWRGILSENFSTWEAMKMHCVVKVSWKTFKDAGGVKCINTPFVNGVFYVFWPLVLYSASLVAQTVKNLPAMQGTRVRSPVWEDSTCHRAAKAQLLSPRTLEPCSATREAKVMRSHHTESSHYLCN